MRTEFKDNDGVFTLMHAMRSRMIQCSSFDSNSIIAAILFEDTMDREIDGRDLVCTSGTENRVVPFLKVDKGLADERDGSRS